MLSSVDNVLRQGGSCGKKKRTTTHLVSVKTGFKKSPTRIMASSVSHSDRYRNIGHGMYITLLTDSTWKMLTDLSRKSGIEQHGRTNSHLEKGEVWTAPLQEDPQSMFCIRSIKTTTTTSFLNLNSLLC